MSETEAKTHLAKAVRSWRRKLGFSQEELAERADLHRTYISDIERGARNVSLGSITRLARALGISLGALFAGFSSASEKHVRKPVDILLVEDNEGDAEITLRALRDSCFANKVEVAHDGEEAIDHLFERDHPSHRPHLVLLDLALPKVNGKEVLKRMKSDARTKSIPVIVQTASTTDPEIEECRKLGADEFITKPVDLKQLIKIAPALNFFWLLMKPTELETQNAPAGRS